MDKCSFTQSSVLRRSMTATGVAALLALTACASDGSLSVGDGGSSATPTSRIGGSSERIGQDTSTACVLSATNCVLQQTGNTTSTVGAAVASVGTQLVGALPAGLNTPVTQGVAGALDRVGDAIDSLGSGVANGLGQMGEIDNPVGVTVASLGAVTSNAGQAVSALGAGISAGVPQLGVVGNLVHQGGAGVTQLGGQLSNTLDSAVVQQVTRTASQVVVPITMGLLQTTQQVGESTGLGQPVHNLLTAAGGLIHQTGQSLAGDGQTPVVSTLGQVVADTGTTVALLGGVVVQPGATPGNGGLGLGGGLLSLPGLGGGNTGGSPLGGLLAPVVPLVGALTGGALPSGNGMLPAGGLSGITGAVTGSPAATGTVLAPVTGLVTGLTGGNAAPGLLAPVTSLLGNLTGGLRK